MTTPKRYEELSLDILSDLNGYTCEGDSEGVEDYDSRDVDIVANALRTVAYEAQVRVLEEVARLIDGHDDVIDRIQARLAVPEGERAKLAESVLQRCIDWTKDTGECHLCGFDTEDGTPHDESCELSRLPLTPGACDV